MPERRRSPRDPAGGARRAGRPPGKSAGAGGRAGGSGRRGGGEGGAKGAGRPLRASRSSGAGRTGASGGLGRGGHRSGERRGHPSAGGASRRSGEETPKRLDRRADGRGGEGREAAPAKRALRGSRGGDASGPRSAAPPPAARRARTGAGSPPGPRARTGTPRGAGSGGVRRPGAPARSAGRAESQKWGGVARRGLRSLHTTESGGPSASEIWRAAVARSGRGAEDEGWEPEEVWVAEPEEQPSRPSRAEPPRPRDLATGPEGVASPGGRRRTIPRPVVEELSLTAGAARGEKLAERLADATYAFERERYPEARRMLRPLVEEVPASEAARELYGLVLYRLGQYAAAARQLEVFRELSGSLDQHPVLADCYRALRRYEDAERLWDELRQASPSGDLVAEGRIVAAGCKADQGDLPGAILMLEKASRRPARPAERHLRQWYALADLYERAGDLPRARDLFNRIASRDPEAFDVKSRLKALR